MSVEEISRSAGAPHAILESQLPAKRQPHAGESLMRSAAVADDRHKPQRQRRLGVRGQAACRGENLGGKAARPLSRRRSGEPDDRWSRVDGSGPNRPHRQWAKTPSHSCIMKRRSKDALTKNLRNARRDSRNRGIAARMAAVLWTVVEYLTWSRTVMRRPVPRLTMTGIGANTKSAELTTKARR